jgi:sensor histidine kinase regulating citrate/malate metabolism
MKKSLIVSTLAVVIVLVSLNNAFYFVFTQHSDHSTYSTLLLITNSLVTILSLVSVIILIHLVIKSRDQYLKNLQMKYIEEVNEMMTAIRGERHDMMNHMNTVHALVTLKQYDELYQYTKALVDDVTITSDLFLIGHPTIAALLHCKMIAAQQYGIPFTYNCDNLSHFPSGLRSLDIVRLIGNLLDNSFEAAARFPLDQRYVHIRIWVNNNNLHIVVTNPGVINPEEAEFLFEPGYTTKNRHSGLGLPIVKQLVNKYKGSIRLDLKEPGIITFDVRVGLQSVS